MMHKSNGAKCIWQAIEHGLIESRMSDSDIARAADVSSRTVRNDRAYPEKIPVGRLLKYLSAMFGNEIIPDLLSSAVLNRCLSDERKSTWE